MKKLVFLWLMSYSILANSATWVLADVDDLVMVYLDADSISRDGDKTTAWLMYVYFDLKPLRFNLRKEIHSCKTRTVQAIASHLYSTDAAVISNEIPDKLIDVRPDSGDERLFKKVCDPDYVARARNNNPIKSPEAYTQEIRKQFKK